ncbi:MAG TPA: tetratricopeptide repeat protein [Mycobacteriales bacterium]|nr:tetratricopeptide repeat protein [Mycobacteriales bacterium]
MDDVFELYRSAERLLAKGDVREAVRNLERAAELEPESTAVRRLLARAYFKSAALSRSEEAARSVVDRDPADAETMHLLGRCLTRQGRSDEAGRWLRLAAAMDPRPEYASEVEITDDSSQFEFDIELTDPPR